MRLSINHTLNFKVRFRNSVFPPAPHRSQDRRTVTMESHTASSDSKDPASFLSSIIGVPVTVKLNSGVVYKGELQSVDGYMNIALEKCQEFVNGQLRRSHGDAFVRGNNGEKSSIARQAIARKLTRPSSFIYLEQLIEHCCDLIAMTPTMPEVKQTYLPPFKSEGL
jgi:U6 snRNA-associated Sm-like protein LSm6